MFELLEFDLLFSFSGDERMREGFGVWICAGFTWTRLFGGFWLSIGELED